MKKEGNQIKSDVGKTLLCNWDGENYGYEFWLGYAYYKDGEALSEPYLLTENDFTEIDDPWIEEVTANELGLQNGFTYGDAKAAVVKVRYSYDDQIALMLNYEENPQKYEEAYIDMQKWRDVASTIAKRLIENR